MAPGWPHLNRRQFPQASRRHTTSMAHGTTFNMRRVLVCVSQIVCAPKHVAWPFPSQGSNLSRHAITVHCPQRSTLVESAPPNCLSEKAILQLNPPVRDLEGRLQKTPTRLPSPRRHHEPISHGGGSFGLSLWDLPESPRGLLDFILRRKRNEAE